MRQYRIIVLFVALVAAFVIPASGVGAQPVDKVAGPSCGDIVLSDPDISGPPVYSTSLGTTPATLYARLSISGAVASCPGVVYTIYVYATDRAGTPLTTSPLTTRSYNGDRTTSDFGLFTYQPPGAPMYLCVYAQSVMLNGHVIDTAPNDGCSSFGEPLVLDGGLPGGQGYF